MGNPPSTLLRTRLRLPWHYDKWVSMITGMNPEIDFTINRESVDYFYHDLGLSGVHADERQEELACRWLHSPEKRNFDQTLSVLAGCFGANQIVNWLSMAVHRIDDGSGFYRSENGFFAGNFNLVGQKIKIRSMVVGAEMQVDNPFDCKSFHPDLINNDPRLLPRPWIKWLRRLSLDELPQLTLGLGNGQFTFVGPRAYTLTELGGTRLCWQTDINKQVLPEAVSSMLKKYVKQVRQLRPKEGIFGPHSIVRNKINHFTRMKLDSIYWQWASPQVDWRIFIGCVWQRMIKGVGAG
jgi:lipopolysaccharide/colanic/teichoic acid biosynthesis glycosyltransferase